MKPLVKSCTQYLRESLTGDEASRLGELGIKTQLNDLDEISYEITEHFSKDPEVQDLIKKLEERLRVLSKEFDQKYIYDPDEMQAAAEQMMEYSHGEEPNIHATVEMVAAWGMV